MPNWCMNTIEIKGPEKEVDTFVAKFEEKGISAFYPTPKELLDVSAPAESNEPEEVVKRNIEKYGYPDWYDWRLANWGTKWDVCELNLMSHDMGEAWFSFDTAWAPPIKAFEKIAEMNPKLTFIIEYYEPLMGFFGKVEFKEGKLSYSEEYETDEKFKSGWELFKQVEEIDNVFEDIYDYLSSEEILSEEELNKVEDKYNSIKDDEEMRAFLSVLYDMEKDKIIKYLEKKGVHNE